MFVLKEEIVKCHHLDSTYYVSVSLLSALNILIPLTVPKFYEVENNWCPYVTDKETKASNHSHSKSHR